MKLLKLICTLLLITNFCCGQSINTSIPEEINKSGRYMFYLHGRIVEEQGKHATHPILGTYEYLAILDSLSKKGFNVISEVRPKNTDEKLYADKVITQIDSLIKSGISPKNIFVFGASKGAYISLWISAKAKNKNLNFIVMGTCSDETSNDFKDPKYNLYGNFLSIYETSDSFSTSCFKMLSNQKCVKGFSEIKLTMNNGHAFLFKPYEQWLNPMIKWANLKK